MPRTAAVTPEKFATFGELLRFLRRKAKLTQRELAIAVGYSESQISRLEKNERAPDEATLAAQFVPALFLDEEPAWVARLLYLGAGTTSATPEIPTTPHNLPIQLTSFIGREKEIGEIKRLLSDRDESIRLLTLTGHGGCGKTRLALQVAPELLDVFPDGVWLIELAPLIDSSLVAETVADTLKVQEEPDKPINSSLTDYLRDRKMLLIMDNCEHLIAATAELVDTLLHACPGVSIMATSREMLGVAGERPFYVPSLSMPTSSQLPSIETLTQFEAVHLFVDRAATVMPDFALTDENAPAIAQICQRLDGIPLALELAAARVKVLSVEQIAARLTNTFRLLTGGNRTAVPRQQTLQATIDWSYDLLPEMERRLFNRLAVFSGGWMLEAAESVCAGDGIDTAEILDGLEQLANKSLVRVERGENGATRYRLLEIIRQYARMKLVESGEADTVRRRHAGYYLALADVGAPHTPKDPTKFTWLDRLELENRNLRAALTWTMSTMDNPDFGQQQIRKGHVQTSAWALNRLGWMARERGDTAAARARLEQSLAIYRELDDKLGIAWTAVTLGEVLVMQEDAELAETVLSEGLMLARQLTENHAIGWALNHLAHVAQLTGDHARAIRQLHESRQVFQSQEPHAPGVAWAYHGLGESALAQGNAKLAEQNFDQALTMFNDMEDGNGVAWCVAGIAGVAALNKKLERAAWLWGAEDNLQKSLGGRGSSAARLTHERLKSSVRDRLGEEKFNARWAEGQVASWEQAVAEALRS
jgi:predicted ATPase/transcriptional regulator with XRE-family HTH domain